MDSAKPFMFEGQEQHNRFVDIEKGDEIKEAKTKAQLEVPIGNQARVTLITGITTIVMLMVLAVYVVLSFIAFKNVRVGLAVGFSVSMAPLYICTLKALLVFRDNLIERDGMTSSNTNGGNPPSEMK